MLEYLISGVCIVEDRSERWACGDVRNSSLGETSGYFAPFRVYYPAAEVCGSS